MGRNSKKYQFIKVQVVPPDGDPYDEVLPRLNFLQHAGALIGGYAVALVSTQDPTLVLVVDEDGMLKRLPVNPEASKHYPQPVVGIALKLPIAEWRRALRDRD